MLTPAKAWLWLTTRVSPGPAHRLLQIFDTPEQVFYAQSGDFSHLGLSEEQLQRLGDKSLEEPERILTECERRKIRLLTWQDTAYPLRLRNIDLPPLVLYYRGMLPQLDNEIAIALAGTRHCSPYGRTVAAMLGREIAIRGGLLVTGAGYGCDATALRAALDTGSPAVCLLPGGVDVPYQDNDEGRRLLRDAAEQGAVLSAAPPGAPHLRKYYSLRNRLLTGATLGVVCVEAPERSGTLSVAALALEQGRDVYAVPSNIDSPSGAGTNRLLARGEAICVCSGDDVLAHYWALYPHKRRPTGDAQVHLPDPELPLPASGPVTRRPARAQSVPEPAPKSEQPQTGLPVVTLRGNEAKFTDDERSILTLLNEGAMITDELVSKTGLPARRVSSCLTVLTIRKLIRQLPGGRFETAVHFVVDE